MLLISQAILSSVSLLLPRLPHVSLAVLISPASLPHALIIVSTFGSECLTAVSSYSRWIFVSVLTFNRAYFFPYNFLFHVAPDVSLLVIPIILLFSLLFWFVYNLPLQHDPKPGLYNLIRGHKHTHTLRQRLSSPAVLHAWLRTTLSCTVSVRCSVFTGACMCDSDILQSVSFTGLCFCMCLYITKLRNKNSNKNSGQHCKKKMNRM